ncbi:hypothetical protein BDP27DRAFT_1219963, partial [Rhodocollybia butyracea]
LDYHKAVDAFAAKDRDLREYELSDTEWDSVQLVSNWLKLFRLATTDMSRTSKPMLSIVHSIFRELQADIQNNLRNLPENTPHQIKTGMLAAHRKLSDYYTKFDESPFYLWSSREYFHLTICIFLTLLGSSRSKDYVHQTCRRLQR